MQDPRPFVQIQEAVQSDWFQCLGDGDTGSTCLKLYDDDDVDDDNK